VARDAIAERGCAEVALEHVRRDGDLEIFRGVGCGGAYEVAIAPMIRDGIGIPQPVIVTSSHQLNADLEAFLRQR
jgi:hypothetical protein